MTTNEMPAHNHYGSLFRDTSTTDSVGVNGGSAGGTGIAVVNGKWAGSLTIRSQGSGQAHTNLPPYLTAYLWQRIS